jgi:hypothetical protein
MGLLAKKEVDGIVYEIYITHLYKDKWVNTNKNYSQILTYFNGNFKYKQTILINKLEDHPYGTICKVIIYYENISIPILEVQDKVICHPKDKFSRKEGRMLSFNKVLSKIKELNNREDIDIKILETLIK